MTLALAALDELLEANRAAQVATEAQLAKVCEAIKAKRALVRRATRGAGGDEDGHTGGPLVAVPPTSQAGMHATCEREAFARGRSGAWLRGVPLSDHGRYLEQLQRVLDEHGRPWSAVDRARLRRAVEEDLQRQRRMAEVQQQQPPPQQERRGEGKQDADGFMVNWDMVARTCGVGRTPFECRQQWEQRVADTINRGAFAADEDVRLARLASEHGEHEWDRVAEALGTRRTALACLRHYSRRAAAAAVRRRWTAAEDALLREAVTLHGEKNWQLVSTRIPGRTGQQCLHRWQKSVAPNIRRARWTADEDVRLRVAVRHYGAGNWVAVRAHVPGRTDVQCRERYCNALDERIRSDPWSPEDDARMMAAVARVGTTKWSRVAAVMGGDRTDNQVWRRWKQIAEPADVRAYKRTVQPPPVTAAAQAITLPCGDGMGVKPAKLRQMLARLDAAKDAAVTLDSIDMPMLGPSAPLAPTRRTLTAFARLCNVVMPNAPLAAAAQRVARDPACATEGTPPLEVTPGKRPRDASIAPEDTEDAWRTHAPKRPKLTLKSVTHVNSIAVRQWLATAFLHPLALSLARVGDDNYAAQVVRQARGDEEETKEAS